MDAYKVGDVLRVAKGKYTGHHVRVTFIHNNPFIYGCKLEGEFTQLALFEEELERLNVVELTESQKERYIRNPTRCPWCKSSALEWGVLVMKWGVLDTEAGTVIQEVCCLGCQSEWEDVYTLSDVRA